MARIEWCGRTYDSAKQLVERRGNGVSYDLYKKRRHRGWDVTDALITPPHDANVLTDLPTYYLYGCGYSTKQIATILGISQRKVQNSIYLKYKRHKNDK